MLLFFLLKTVKLFPKWTKNRITIETAFNDTGRKWEKYTETITIVDIQFLKNWQKCCIFFVFVFLARKRKSLTAFNHENPANISEEILFISFYSFIRSNHVTCTVRVRVKTLF